ncbi:hypothetical protein M514_17970 [Trichuris suis]|uniref:Uncharacterized protein n=1 Tax=Trichuris suis TaxID=68888 RepID=A0A085NK52_9BILA|nr:hypothetical protein M514_17970 [Trichuris suis]
MAETSSGHLNQSDVSAPAALLTNKEKYRELKKRFKFLVYITNVDFAVRTISAGKVHWNDRKFDIPWFLHAKAHIQVTTTATPRANR